LTCPGGYPPPWAACGGLSAKSAALRRFTGPRTYFCRAAKVGKNALRKLRFLRTFLNYGGILFAPEA